MITFTCTHCGFSRQFPVESAGKSIKCKCGTYGHLPDYDRSSETIHAIRSDVASIRFYTGCLLLVVIAPVLVGAFLVGLTFLGMSLPR